MGVFDERLRELMTETSNTRVTDPAAGTHAISRTTLRLLLLAGPRDIVHFGKEFTRYDRSVDGRVTAYFADGTAATGDVLVGADGARSRVRRQLLPDAEPVDLPAVGVGGKLPITELTGAWLPEPITTNKNMILPAKDFMFTAAFRPRRDSQEAALSAADQLRAIGLDPEVVLQERVDSRYVMWAFVAHRQSYPTGITDLHGSALLELIEERAHGGPAPRVRFPRPAPAAALRRGRPPGDERTCRGARSGGRSRAAARARSAVRLRRSSARPP